MKRTDIYALVSSVKKAWAVRGNTIGLDHVISKVWGRLRNVLVLIVEGGGSNDSVEKKRGRRFRNLDMSQEFLTAYDGPPPQDEAADTDDDPLYLDLIVDQEEEDSDNEIAYRI